MNVVGLVLIGLQHRSCSCNSKLSQNSERSQDKEAVHVIQNYIRTPDDRKSHTVTGLEKGNSNEGSRHSGSSVETLGYRTAEVNSKVPSTYLTISCPERGKDNEGSRVSGSSVETLGCRAAEVNSKVPSTYMTMSCPERGKDDEGSQVSRSSVETLDYWFAEANSNKRSCRRHTKGVIKVLLVTFPGAHCYTEIHLGCWVLLSVNKAFRRMATSVLPSPSSPTWTCQYFRIQEPLKFWLRTKRRSSHNLQTGQPSSVGIGKQDCDAVSGRKEYLKEREGHEQISLPKRTQVALKTQTSCNRPCENTGRRHH
ncbi:hypothetical protein J6590_053316 [Homalodisca vitripennis]|nr:hypothetical protein J6590_053316 [Homalodisca vitripennis]